MILLLRQHRLLYLIVDLCLEVYYVCLDSHQSVLRLNQLLYLDIPLILLFYRFLNAILCIITVSEIGLLSFLLHALFLLLSLEDAARDHGGLFGERAASIAHLSQAVAGATGELAIVSLAGLRAALRQDVLFEGQAKVVTLANEEFAWLGLPMVYVAEGGAKGDR